MDYRNINVLIWDIDGVLIYVRESYREAIVESAKYYMKELMGIKTESSLLSVEDTQRFKMAEGFNDDWKLTYAFVLCLLAKAVSKNRSLLAINESPADLPGKLDLLKKAGAMASDTDLSIDYEKIVSEVKTAGVGLEGVEKALVNIFGAGCVEAAKRIWLTDVIKQVFQEMYLGTDLYEKKYGAAPRFFKRPGLIRHEHPIVSLKTLEKLSERFVMGVASGRERFEAEFSLKEYGFDAFIPLEYAVTSEDVSHGKPDPESLLLCQKKIVRAGKLSCGPVGAVYIGDSVDDIRAAKNAGFFSVGCLSASMGVEEKRRLRAEFQKLKCDMIVNDANHLAVWVR